MLGDNREYSHLQSLLLLQCCLIYLEDLDRNVVIPIACHGSSTYMTLTFATAKVTIAYRLPPTCIIISIDDILQLASISSNNCFVCYS